MPEFDSFRPARWSQTPLERNGHWYVPAVDSGQPDSDIRRFLVTSLPSGPLQVRVRNSTGESGI